MDSSQREILLLGGSGYVGSVVARHLLGCGYRVRCLDALVYDNQSAALANLGTPGYSFIHGDLTDTSQASDFIGDATDVIILAGLVGDPVTKKYPRESKHINETGMWEFIGTLAGRGLGKVIFVSTCSNYGLRPSSELAAEGDPLRPLSLYAESKVRIEQGLLSLAGEVDYSATMLRFATAFGLSPRMRFDLTVSQFTRSLFEREDLLVYDADTWRPYCHVRDFAAALELVLRVDREKTDFEVFNVGGDRNNFTKRMIVDEVLKHIDGATVRYKEHGTDPRNYRVDFSKIRRALGFVPAISLEDGIVELVSALSHGFFRDFDEHRNRYGNFEISYEIPSGHAV